MRRAFEIQNTDPRSEAVNRLLGSMESLSQEAEAHRKQVWQARTIAVLLFILVLL